MPEMKQRFIPIIAAVILASLLCLVFLGWALTKGITRPDEEQIFLPVAIIGQYSMDGSKYRPLRAGMPFNVSSRHILMVKGHFSRHIEKDALLIMHICGMRASMKINGKEVFVSDAENSRPRFSGHAEHCWRSFLSPGLSTADLVEFTLHNEYANHNDPVFNLFLNNLIVGTQNDFLKTLQKRPGNFFLGMFCISLGVGIFFASLLVWALKHPGGARLFFLSGFITIGGAWFLHDSVPLHVPPLESHPIFSGILEALCVYLIPLFLLPYLMTFLERQGKIIVKTTHFALLLFLTAAMALQLLGLTERYEMRLVHLVLIPCAGIVITAAIGYEAVKLKNRRAAVLLVLFIPLVLGTAFDLLNFYKGFLPDDLNIGFKIGLLAVILFQLVNTVLYIKKGADGINRSRQLERELTDIRIATLFSQIRPHFLYNALTAIKRLCATDPKKAEDAVTSFANFLRGNLDALSSPAPIPFEREFAHVAYYLNLEKMRFGDRLNVIYALQYKAFMLPALTLQPIVENAVRHGVTRREQGGTIIISTREKEDRVVVTVRDDGVGFDPKETGKDGKTHIGIENVRSRLKNFCGGTVLVESGMDKGTTVTIIMPKEKPCAS